jgi:DNA-binding SARP family transcriptional activator
LYAQGVPICSQVMAEGAGVGDHKILAPWTKLGLRSTGQVRWSSGANSGPQIYVFCLGPFRVYLNGRKIGEADWGQGKGPAQKVKALFAYLVAKGSHGATKDQIVELLWPGQPPSDNGDTRFHAAMYYLRRALEPDLPPGKRSQYVVYRDGRYRLYPPGGYWVDATAFEGYYEQAMHLEEAGLEDKAARHLHLAAALYQGEYMAGVDQRYTEGYEDDWCQFQRHRLKQMYLRVVLKLAAYHYRRGEDRQSWIYAQKALEEDHACEEAHCLLMKLAHRAGQPDEVTRLYRLCRRYVQQAEDRDPTPATTQLYRELLRATLPATA